MATVKSHKAVHPVCGEPPNLFQLAAEGILLVDRQTGMVLRGNPAACNMLGCEERRLAAAPLADLFPESSRQQVLQIVDAMREGRCQRSEQEDVALQRRDNGATIYVDLVLAETASNDRPCLAAFLRDVTERHDLALVVDVQHELAKAVSEAKDFHAPLSRFLDLILRMPGIDCGGVYLMDPSTGEADLAYHRGVLPQFVAAISHFHADAAEIQVARLGKPCYNHVASEFNHATLNAAEREGIRSTALIPMMHQDRLVGMLSFASHTREDIPLCTRRVLENVACTVAGLIVRVRTEASLATTEDRTRLILNRALDGFAVIDLDGFIQEANHTFGQMVGYSCDELVGMHVSDLDAEHPPTAAKDLIAQIRQDGAARFPARHRHKNGSWIDLDVSVHYCRCGDQELLFAFLRDVGAQHRTEQALREAEHRYSLIANNVNDVIWTTKIVLSDDEKRQFLGGRWEELAAGLVARWRFSFVSPSVTRVFGYTPEEVQSLPLDRFATPATTAQASKALMARLSENANNLSLAASPTTLELEVICKDGRTRWCESVSTYLRDEAGWPVGVLGITRDISQRRRAEGALRESEAKLRGLLENLPDSVLLVDREAKIRYINRNADRTPLEERLNTSVLDLAAPESREACLTAINACLANGQSQLVEACDHRGHWWACRIVPIAESGSLDHLMVICTDITEQRVARETLQKEQALLRRLLDLHEQDRQITAYDIHDGFVQYLAGALFRLQAFRETLARDPAAGWEALETAKNMVRKAIDDARRLISGLRPPILDEAGIVEAVEYLVCENQTPGGPEIDFRHEVLFDRLPPPLETALFRIIQESLRNACRHSRSDRILVTLTEKDQRLILEVRDWGVGFDPNRIAEQRFGLQGLRERVRLLGGSVAIESKPNEGAAIRVELPTLPPNN